MPLEGKYAKGDMAPWSHSKVVKPDAFMSKEEYESIKFESLKRKVKEIKERFLLSQQKEIQIKEMDSLRNMPAKQHGWIAGCISGLGSIFGL